MDCQKNDEKVTAIDIAKQMVAERQITQNEEEIIKLADEYYNNVLIKECAMEENMAKHCRLSYLHGLMEIQKKKREEKAFEMKTIAESLGFTTQEECDEYNEMVTNLIMGDDKGEQKSAEWKQENVEELSDFENVMMHIGRSFFGQNAGLDPNDSASIKEQAKLLLELTPKQEWSEDDENKIDTIINIYHPSPNIVNWLKSLKEKYTWKPSGEQLYILHWLATNVLTDGEVDKKASEILYTLYDDLKKLKGE